MKIKRLVSFAAVCAVFIQLTATSAFAAQAMTPAGDLLETDISTYINGCQINSYNVNGYTAIIAEDLTKYGFSVAWNNVARTLTITRSENNEFSGELLFGKENINVGKKTGTAYHTDIRTFVNGVTVLSYNIGGKTAIFTDALKLFGDVRFDSNSRSVFCTIEGLTYKKPMVTITDPDDNTGGIDVDVPVNVPVPPTSETTPTANVMFYSNGVVPDYGTVTGAVLQKSEDKSNGYISYKYDNYDEFAAEKYVTYIVDKAGFTLSKTDKKENTLIYYYLKGNTALAMEIDNSANTLTLTCKK